MRKKGIVNLTLIILFFVFSLWLFGKSFGYENGEFRIARHQVGDFGLHLGLIRSFSWGQNIPPQSPFFPGPPLPYHYATDMAAGLLERVGVRIDHALNGISVIFFTLLLFLIYNFSNLLFGYSPIQSLIAVVLFLLSSNLTFVTFLKQSTFAEVWRLPDYIYKGPFDGSVISIFSTLNPLLNQRHLIVGLALSLLIFTRIQKQKISTIELILLGILLGILTRIHTLVAFGTAIVVTGMTIYKSRFMILLSVAFLFALPHLRLFFTNDSRSLVDFFRPGFLAAAPVTIYSWLTFWWQNLGLTLIFLPIGVFLANSKQKRVFFSFLLLFILANIFQFSYRIEHNHSLITMFLIISNMFVAYAIMRLPKIWTVMCLFFLTASGILNLMVVKNDFQYRVADAPKDTLISWILENTPKDSIFLAPQNLYDPVVLAGRKNFFGATYYSEVMGYDIEARREVAATGKIDDVDYLISTEREVDREPVFTNEKYWVYKL